MKKTSSFTDRKTFKNPFANSPFAGRPRKQSRPVTTEQIGVLLNKPVTRRLKQVRLKPAVEENKVCLVRQRMLRTSWRC